MTPSDEDKARVVLRVRSRVLGGPEQETAPLSPPPAGLRIGTASPVAFYCNRDAHVDAAHGTLERTARHGVWVFVDHSAHGSIHNGRTRVHRDAVIVRSGDTLTLGSTDIGLTIVTKEATAARQPDGKRQVASNVASNVYTGRRRSMPKRSIARIDTSPARPELLPPVFKRATSASAATGAPAAAVPEYINSPIPGSSWRRRRNSMATTTVRTAVVTGSDGFGGAKAIPSPPESAIAQPFPYPRGRMLVPPASTATSAASSNSKALDTPTRKNDMANYQRQHQLNVRTASPGVVLEPPPPPPSPPPASPIPLEYSASPVSSPSAFLRRLHDRRELEGKQTTSGLGSHPSGYAGGAPDSGQPKSRRDDLRIQVSKKMAAAAAEGHGGSANQRERPTRARQLPVGDATTRIQQRTLDFTPPSSPVPQSDLQRQQRSLLATLKLKYREEQLLKQQQEEWMRRRFGGATTRSDGDRTPPLSPIRSSNQIAHSTTPASPRDSSNEEEVEARSLVPAPGLRVDIPGRLPELLRTQSTGAQNYLPSPRVAAALMASRAARANAANHLGRLPRDDVDGKDDGHEDAPIRSGQTGDEGNSCGKVSSGRLRARSSSTSSSDSVSVSSSVTTVPARYRRVTRSLSVGSLSESNASEPRSSPPSPLEESCSEKDLAVPDFFIGYGDDTDEDEDDAGVFHFYPDVESVTRSRDDSMPLIGSTTSKLAIERETAPNSSPLSASSRSGTQSSYGLFPMGALRSPRRLTDEDGSIHRSHRHHDYLEAKLRVRESDHTSDERIDEHRPWAVATGKSYKPTDGGDNNRSHGFFQGEKLPLPPRSQRRRSAPPETLTLGLPTSKLALALAPSQRNARPPEKNQQDETQEQPEMDEDDDEFGRASPPPPPPPPSAEAPANGAGPRRPSFRRRSAFALA